MEEVSEVYHEREANKLTRCEEFYERWRRDPNWCEKCPTEVYRINKYIETLDAFPTLREVSAGALRPILEKKMDVDTRKKLLSEVAEKVKVDGSITSSDIATLMTQFPIGKKEGQNESIPKVEKRIIHAVTWKETMHPTVSRMDEAVYDRLQEKGISALFQESVCVLTLIPDVLIQKGNKTYAVFLDGPVHEGREERDEANRELLSRRGIEVLSFRYDVYSEAARDDIVTQISEYIGG